jgi:hypothetical protein
VYRAYLAEVADFQEGSSENAPLRRESDLNRFYERLDAVRVEARSWWGSGYHRQQAFAEFSRAPLPVAEGIARLTVGLPIYQALGP